ncbi:hypothetical protein BGX29_006731 [Mortierella sp. GBA35]|nr:hypothetical protein BGX29_006731 [Mortierella sp. GBA35]
MCRQHPKRIIYEDEEDTSSSDSGAPPLKRNRSEEEEKEEEVVETFAIVKKCDAKLLKPDKRVSATRKTLEETKDTFKSFYVDPCISVVGKKHNVPLEKIFAKTLRDMFE